MSRRKARKSKQAPSPLPAIGLLLAFGAAGGVLYNMLAPRGIFRPAPVAPAGEKVADRAKPKPPASAASQPGSETRTGQGEIPAPAEPRVVTLEEAKRIFSEGSAMIVDARSAQSYALGHIPGAISIPSDDFEAAYAQRQTLLPLSVRVLVYCSSANCDESHIVLKGLAEKGHGRLLHYANGWNEWEIAGMPQENSLPERRER